MEQALPKTSGHLPGNHEGPSCSLDGLCALLCFFVLLCGLPAPSRARHAMSSTAIRARVGGLRRRFELSEQGSHTAPQGQGLEESEKQPNGSCEK